MLNKLLPIRPMKKYHTENSKIQDAVTTNSQSNIQIKIIMNKTKKKKTINGNV